MYRIVRASIQYYNESMRGAGVRHRLVTPFMLLVNLNQFQKEKAMGTEAYVNLCDIVERMKMLYLTGKPMYHHFDMLLREIQALGFDIKNMEPSHKTDSEKLREQIDLMLQFLACRYPFDAYDNKTGVHNPATNEFIFIQP